MNQEQRNVILTIREYENSVEMPEGDRLTFLDSRGGVHLKVGDRFSGAPEYVQRAEQCAEYLRFGEEVDAVTCGEFPRSSALKLCDTPSLYREAGFAPLPMLYTQRHLLNAVRPKDMDEHHRHGLSLAQMKRLPELLSDPVMLCDSPSRDDVLLVLLCEVDGDRQPLIAAIRPGGHGFYERRELETNFILAVYGRANFSLYFNDIITLDKVIYYNEERGRELNALAKLHLLGSRVVEPDLNKKIIRRPLCLVNSKTAGQSNYSLRSMEKDARTASLTLGKGGQSERIEYREGR